MDVHMWRNHRFVFMMRLYIENIISLLVDKIFD